MHAPQTRDPNVLSDDQLVSDWQRFLRLFLLAFLGVLAAIASFLVIIDPYDSGRFPTPMPSGVNDGVFLTANVSRGRDLRFNAAILGNSHVALINPQRLSAATGLSFVHLELPGTGPVDQAIVFRWFLRHHPSPTAVVVGLDPKACSHDIVVPTPYGVPAWLYGSNDAYLSHLLNLRAIRRAGDRILLALGRVAPADPDGFWDYETWTSWNNRAHPAAVEREAIDLSPAALSDSTFPGLDVFETAFADLPTSTPVIFVFPPQHISFLPEPGGAIWREVKTCKNDLVRRVSAHAGWHYLDFLTDTPETRDPANFIDGDHYRVALARQIEAHLVGILRPSGTPTLSEK